MHLVYKPTSIKMPRPQHKGYNKHNPDVTIPHGGIEYAMGMAPIHAYYASERLAESNNRHESLKDYDHQLMADANYIPQREHNPRLEQARKIKIDRHRTMLPQLLF